MKRNSQRGVGDGLFLIVIITLLILSWIGLAVSKKGTVGPFGANKNPWAIPMPEYSNTSSGSSYGSSGGVSTVAGPKSTNQGLVTIEPGNGSSENEPFQEYITLIGSSDIKTPINITGWYLTNGKGTRTYQVGSTMTHFASDVAIIPKGINVFDPSSGGGTLAPIMLSAGGRVTVLTGTANYNGHSLPSFRDNECVGYLSSDHLHPINLYPNTYSSCPNPTREAGVDGLDQSCRQFVESMSYCHTPNFIDSVVVDNVPQNGYVDGVGGLSPYCQNYLAAHFNYQSCVANHEGDATFLTDNWRVYLNRPWEMWAADHDIITLYDANGGIVDQYSY